MAKDRMQKEPQATPFVIITGLSGAGKGTFLRALEDRGYFCVDNLPVGFATKFSELILHSQDDTQRAALVVDVREGQALERFPQTYAELKGNRDLVVRSFFLEASNEALIRRFSETRRPHPLDPTLPVREAIDLERTRLGAIRALVDHVVDTSHFSVHELRQYADGLLEDRNTKSLLLTLISFGYKYGIPVDADMIFDVRFLPNPHFVPELKPLTGADRPVVDFMHSHEVTQRFLEQLLSMLTFLLPQFEREGKSYLTIGIGCTGGRHRSVMIADAVQAALTQGTSRLRIQHRDVDKA